MRYTTRTMADRSRPRTMPVERTAGGGFLGMTRGGIPGGIVWGTAFGVAFANLGADLGASIVDYYYDETDF